MSEAELGALYHEPDYYDWVRWQNTNNEDGELCVLCLHIAAHDPDCANADCPTR